MTGEQARWYWNRLRAMSATEVAFRSRDQALQLLWMRRQVRPGSPPGRPTEVGAHPRPRRFTARLPAGAAATVPSGARDALLAAASAVRQGRWEVLGVVRNDLADPDWFIDPVTGRRAPDIPYCFRIDHRCEAETGNVKQVWELSRHHHLTLLAAAFLVSGNEAYATAVDRQLRDWWRRNPFLSGVHWTSGIELGIRLISWTWIRRLLDGWPGVSELFEDNDDAVRQIGWHQEYLAAFRSRGTSANNHVIAEAAGRLVAACAFPWFSRSERWREEAAGVLERELANNTFETGINRELASDYHGFVAELGMLAAVEAAAAGYAPGQATWARLARMADAAAGIVDARTRPPRQGDGDDGRALVVDGGEREGWRSLLAAASAVVGAREWWPAVASDVRSCLLAALLADGAGNGAGAGTGPGRADAPAAGAEISPAGPGAAPARGRGRPPAGDLRGGWPGRRPSHFPDAGLTLLRTAGEAPEIWCRCDAGPHGFLGIAAHAHADALSVEVRHGGIDVLADPGTYCYHGEPAWRSYFRSTLGHNTLELAGQDQSTAGGAFLWTAHARTQLLRVGSGPDGGIVSWTAEHDGYHRLDPPATHRRSVTLDAAGRRLEIADTVDCSGRHPCRLAFHLGPAVAVTLEGSEATLRWAGGRATLRMPVALVWSLHRGETDPILGWYSPRFGTKVPSAVLVGTGTAGGEAASGDRPLVTVLEFDP